MNEITVRTYMNVNVNLKIEGDRKDFFLFRTEDENKRHVQTENKLCRQ